MLNFYKKNNRIILSPDFGEKIYDKSNINRCGSSGGSKSCSNKKQSTGGI